MLKTIGLIILILSGTLKGVTVSEKYSKRVRFLRSYIDFLIHLKSQISYSEKTLFEILKNYSCPQILKTRLNKCLQNFDSDSFENLWKNAFLDAYIETGITSEENSMIINFGKEIGKYDVSEQINYISYSLDFFQNHIKDALDNLNSKGKLPIIIGVCLGFAVALILM